MISPVYVSFAASAPEETCCLGLSHHREFSGLVILYFGAKELPSFSGFL